MNLADIKVSSTECVNCNNVKYYSVFQQVYHYEIMEIKKEFNHQILICCNCGLGTIDLNDSYSDENLNLYYKSVNRTPIDFLNLKDDDARVLNGKNRVEFIKMYAKGNDYLEIGFGDGVTLNEAINSGFNCTGIDPSVGYNYNYQYLKNKGANLYTEFFSSESNIGKFDVVAYFLVLEHIKNPIKFIEESANFLAENGLLVIEVPDILNYQNFLSETILTPEHIYHYSIGTLSSLMESLGFCLVAFQSPGTGYPFTLTAIFQKQKKDIFSIHIDRDINGEIALQAFNSYLNRMELIRKLLIEEVKVVLEKNSNILIFGAGLFISKILNEIPEYLLKNISAFIDETPELKNKTYFGKKIYSLKEIVLTDFDGVILGTEMFNKLLERKVREFDQQIPCYSIIESVKCKI